MGFNATRTEQGDDRDLRMAELAEAVREAVTDRDRMTRLRGIVRGVALQLEALERPWRLWDLERREWIMEAHTGSRELLEPKRCPNWGDVALVADEHWWRSRQKPIEVTHHVWVPEHLHSSREPPRQRPGLVERSQDRHEAPFGQEELLLVAAAIHDERFRDTPVELVDPWKADLGLDEGPAAGIDRLPLRTLFGMWWADQTDQATVDPLNAGGWPLLWEAIREFADPGEVSPEPQATLEARVAAVESVVGSFVKSMDRVIEMVASVGAGGDEVTAVPKLPDLMPHDRQAWQLWQLVGKNQTEVAELLNAEHGTLYTQGQVSRMCDRFQRYIDASDLADCLPKPAGHERAVDPARLELGARTDKRKPRPSDMARADDDAD